MHWPCEKSCSLRDVILMMNLLLISEKGRNLMQMKLSMLYQKPVWTCKEAKQVRVVKIFGCTLPRV